MTKRILFWNIENFALNKINNPHANRDELYTTISQTQASFERNTYINTHITQAQPHIIVVVEIETGYDGRGQLVRGAGMNGAITLLNNIRAATLNPNWMLVPPLQTGPNEGVAVYYDSTNLIFTGPYVWPGGGAGVTAQPPGAAPGAYPLAHAPGFPAPARPVPAGALQNGPVGGVGGINEDMCAARVEFTSPPAWGGPPAPIAYGVTRAPYMVTFAEMNNAVAPPVVARNLTIFGVHSPASFPHAGNYLAELANTTQITAPNAADEVRVVCGDFNVNLLTSIVFALNASYNPMLGGAANYTLALTPTAPPPAPVINGYIGYYSTHIKSWRRAAYFSTNAVPRFYPAYGYTGSHLLANFFAIDNIFTRYPGGGVVPPVPNNFTILNGIVGSPFNVVAVPAGSAPLGTLPFAIAMPDALFAPPLAQAAPFTIGNRRLFLNWTNYLHIRSTSDHMALVMDI